ncbi:CapA family protein [Evansella cellulosilytica]|uniref:Capsule synthesis protein, CapA n=1 Tax=Evansella cellulosilytica (strain ATCC 21833 / DSM 2522 / FERM P-1141 / JCM 9156 / N-4) TaxID=649639 RepID=E6TZ17_EVAC2|nr:CapA family protein [Evansella cellulosilytica]ADU32460.1 Capsule synthesis protein, CapA [Evansella cellulosilytica DSM 2522]
MTKRIIASFVLMAILFGCQEQGKYEGQHFEERKNELSLLNAANDNIERAVVVEEKMTIGAIGDVLLHNRVYELAETDEGKYDFSPMLEEVAHLLEKPDFLMANQESMPGGVEIGLSSYPAFNSPQEIVENLQDVGVDMVIGANNHTLDRGMKAVNSALNFYDEIEMDYVGVYRNTEDRETDRIVEMDGISVGVLAYTYGTNGIPIPQNHPDVVALIEPNRIVSDVANLKEKTDVVVVHMHWGDEYKREPNQEQRQLAQTLSEAGVDIIYGHHPHVLQPIEIVENDVNDNETIVFYSLGNFLSGQYFDFTDIGGIGTVEITKITNGEDVEVSIKNPEIIPTLVVQENDLYRVKPLESTDGSPITGSTFKETIAHTLLYLDEE